MSVTKGQAFKGRCYHIIIVPPNGIKNLVVLVDSVFQKQLLYEAEELAEPTRAHLWNKGSEIRSRPTATYRMYISSHDFLKS